MSLFSDRLWSSSGDYQRGPPAGREEDEENDEEGGGGEEETAPRARLGVGGGGGRKKKLKPLLWCACAHGSHFLRLEFSGVRLSGKIYGEVTAWIAMNSAHPPLSGLVIVLNLLARQVLRAYT